MNDVRSVRSDDTLRVDLPTSVDLSNPNDFLIGMPFDSYIETLNVSRSTSGRTLGRKVSVPRVHMQVANTRGLMVGPDADRMVVEQLRQFQRHGEGVMPYSGFLDKSIPREWNTNGKIRIAHQDPYRVEVLGIIPEVDMGNR